MSWQCLACGAEHADNILFCTACGAERVRTETDAAVPTSWWHRRSTDVVIVIVAMALMSLGAIGFLIACERFRCLDATTVNRVFVPLLFFGEITSLILALLALVRFFASHVLRVQYRLAVLFTTLVFNPVVFMIILFAGYEIMETHRLACRMRNADTNALVQACAYIVQHPQSFLECYYDHSSIAQLPLGIADIKPDCVMISSNAILVQMKKMSDEGWHFMRDDHAHWSLLAHTSDSQKLLLSNIVIATHAEQDAAGTAPP
ncbi:MAG: hypothetical protein NTV22_07190 [bacterium]|nr:hypothetical protein [bacterium]